MWKSSLPGTDKPIQRLDRQSLSITQVLSPMARNSTPAGIAACRSSSKLARAKLSRDGTKVSPRCAWENAPDSPAHLTSLTAVEVTPELSHQMLFLSSTSSC